MVSSVQISGSLCVILEHKHVSQGWNVYVDRLVQISGSLCVLLEHTRVSGVECLSGSLSSNKWFTVCTFGTHTWVSGGMSKWFAQFK